MTKHIPNKEKYMGTITQDEYEKMTSEILIKGNAHFSSFNRTNGVALIQEVKLNESKTGFVNIGFNKKYDIIDNSKFYKYKK